MIIRIFDILLSIVGLILFSPIILIFSILIIINSYGPVFFCPKRVGKDGVIFKMYKLRTMHFSNKQGKIITSNNDQRIFFVGKILRTLKIDEIPQLLNILKGEMSIVGPRAEDNFIVQKFYTKEMYKTLSVRPGLTSFGSLHYFRCLENKINDLDTIEQYVNEILPIKILLDAKMIKKMSLKLYFFIILDTVISIIEKIFLR